MKNRGFTLVELLVVIAIVSMLSSITMSSLGEAREKARVARLLQFESSLYHTMGDRMIGEWTFDNGTLEDTSGYNIHGGFKPDEGYGGTSPTFRNESNDDCIRRGCVLFSGSAEDGFVLPSATFLEDRLTISILFKSNIDPSPTETTCLIRTNGWWDENWTLNIGGWDAVFLPGVTNFIVGDGDEYGVNEVNGNLIRTGSWHHVAATYINNPGTGAELQLFMDGISVARKSFSGAMIKDSIRDLFIGEGQGSYCHLDGYIDDIRIYAGSMMDS